MESRFFSSFCLIVAMAFGTSCSREESVSNEPIELERRELVSEGDFLVILDYPWKKYGFDFGVPEGWGPHGVSSEKGRAQIEEDFAALGEAGVEVVRWHLLGDCRASPEFSEEGMVTGFDGGFFPDIDLALKIAKENDIKLIFVILERLFAGDANVSGNVQMAGRASLVSDAEVR
ncbi:MAG: hypothetical protein AAGC68_10660, partial [Verrucomicrobiota bacterium]